MGKQISVEAKQELVEALRTFKEENPKADEPITCSVFASNTMALRARTSST